MIIATNGNLGMYSAAFATATIVAALIGYEAFSAGLPTYLEANPPRPGAESRILTQAETPGETAAFRALVFPPVDEAAHDPNFLAFRSELLAAIHARAQEAVTAIAHADVKLSFGGSYGRDTFRQWLLENPAFGGLTYWQELALALELGGVFDGPDRFCTPYVFCLDIPGCEACDPYDTLVAVSDRAPVYAAPNPESEIIATLSYGVVAVIDESDYPWSRIRPLSESSRPADKALVGYVTGPEFRSPIDYRAIFERQGDGAWLMTVSIAGD